LGSKNRILISILTQSILHKLRNTFVSKELYITKAKLKKIEVKHEKEAHFLHNHNFQLILDNTIGICSYKHNETIINLISIVENKIYLYSISPTNFYIYLGTFFKSDKRKILKQCGHNIEFLNNFKRKEFEEFI
jgi:hypothetical protein